MHKTPKKLTCEVSFDVEATGACPENGAMVMLGLQPIVLDLYRDDDPSTVMLDKKAFYLKPDRGMEPRCYEEFWSKHPDIWDIIMSRAIEPKEAMAQFRDWFVNLSKTYDVVFIAKPAAYDWQFLKHYYIKYGVPGQPDIGYKAFCISSVMTIMNAIKPIDAPSDFNVWNIIKAPSHLKVTHLADNDATVQAYEYVSMIRYINSLKIYLK